MVSEYNNSKNLNYASFWFCMKDTVVASFLTVYLLRLNATNFQLSLYEVLVALIGIITLIALTVYLDNSQKSFLRFISLDRLTFVIFCGLLFFIRDPLIIIFAYALYAIPNTVTAILSPNYLKEAIPREHWGRVFSKNKMVLVTTNMLTLVVVGLLLDHFRYMFPYNFIVVFFAASFAYVFSYFFLKNIETDTVKVASRPKLSRIKLLEQVDKNLLLMILVQIPIYMIAPLWAIYHVRVLGLSNFQVGMLTVLFSLGGLVSLPYWGKLLDAMSNKKLFVASVFFMALIPIIYTFSKSYYYLLFAQLIMGFIASGYEIVLQNNLMANSKRAEYDFAYMADFQIYQNVVRLGLPPLGILTFSYFGIVPTFLIIGTLRFVVAGVVWYYMRDEYTEKPPQVQLQE